MPSPSFADGRHTLTNNAILPNLRFGQPVSSITLAVSKSRAHMANLHGAKTRMMEDEAADSMPAVAIIGKSLTFSTSVEVEEDYTSPSATLPS